MEDSMTDLPDFVFDEKVSNKRVRDGEDETSIGGLEKRPSGIFGVNGGEDLDGVGVNNEGGGGGILDTFFSNVFHQNESVTELGGEVEDGGVMTSDVVDVVVEEKSEDLGINSGEGHGGDDGGEGESGGGGIINTFISNIFHHNRSGDDGDDQAKNGLHNEVVEKIEDLGVVEHCGGDGGGTGGVEVERVDLDAEKPVEETKNVPDLSSKQVTGQKLKMGPDDYSERVFFLNNN